MGSMQNKRRIRARVDPVDPMNWKRFYMWNGVEINTDKSEVIKTFNRYDFIFSKLALRRDGSAVTAEQFADAVLRASAVNDAVVKRQDELSKVDRRKSVVYKRKKAHCRVVMTSPVSQTELGVAPSASAIPSMAIPDNVGHVPLDTPFLVPLGLDAGDDAELFTSE